MALLKYIIGPEIIWILAAWWAGSFRQVNALRSGSYDAAIENYGMLLAAEITLACITLFLIPVVPRQYLMLRIVVISLIGSHFVLDDIVQAHTKGGPGAGMIYIAGFFLTIVAIGAVAVIKAVFIR